MPKGPIEAVIKLLLEELRDLISGLPEHLQKSVPEQLRGNPPASEGITDPKGSSSEPGPAMKVSLGQSRGGTFMAVRCRALAGGAVD